MIVYITTLGLFRVLEFARSLE